MSIKINGERKYEKHAKDLIYRIPVYRPSPYFINNYSDLSPKLIKELSSLDDINLPIEISRKYGMDKPSNVVIEEKENGIMIRKPEV